MSEAGKQAGLPEEIAHELAVATVCGAGELMHQSGEHPSILRQNVTSPNGTTAAALDVLMHAEGLQPVMSEALPPPSDARGSWPAEVIPATRV